MNEQEQVREPRKRRVTKLNYPLPSYEVSFENHLQIIKAYVELSKEGKQPVSWRDFNGLVSMRPEWVSANNKFLESLGLIKAAEEKGKYYPTEEAIEFSKAVVWEEEAAKRILRELIKKSWFWGVTMQLLNVKGGKCPKDDLIKRLGIVSGATKRHHLSLSILIEYLKYVDLVKEEDGTISYGKFGQEQITPKTIEVPSNKDMMQVKLSDGSLYAVDVRELESFVREKGKKLDEKIYTLMRASQNICRSFRNMDSVPAISTKATIQTIKDTSLAG